MNKRCTRCEHEWVARAAQPKVCPRCKSPYWDKPRVRSASPYRGQPRAVPSHPVGSEPTVDIVDYLTPSPDTQRAEQDFDWGP